MIFASSLTLHVMTAARTVTFSDSGDFLMAISTVGNCHGPGYPLYLMSAKIFSWIFPVGSLAFRVSVFSGLFASLAACLTYWIVLRMTRSRVGGVAAALALSFSYTFWYETVIPETYGLNTFFLSLLLVLMLRWERLLKEGRRGSARNTLSAFAFVFGLSMTNHFSILFSIPAFLFFALDTNSREVFNVRNLVRMAAFFAIGLLPYVYEPAAAFRGPAYNYGDPSTLARWFDHVTLNYQRGGLFTYPLRFLPARFWRYFGTLTTEFPYFFWLAAVGLVASFLKKNKKYALFVSLLFVFTTITVMCYDQLESVLRAHFYGPSYFVVTLWIGFGAAWIANLVKRWSRGRDRILSAGALGITGAVLVLLCCSSIPEHYNKVDKSNYRYARDMALKMLSKADREGVILTDSDNVIFPLKYMQYVEGVSPAADVVNPKSLGVPGWTATDLNRAVLPPGEELKPAEGDYARVTKQKYHSVPVFSSGLTFSFFGWSQEWEGLLLRIYPPGAQRKAASPVVLAQGGEPLADLDSDAREAIVLSDLMAVYNKIHSGETEEAARLCEKVTQYAGRDLYVPTLYGCETISNTYDVWGQLLSQQGKYKKVVRELPKARLFNPDFVSLSLAEAYMRTGNDSTAEDELSKFLVIHPNSAAAYEKLGELQLVRGDFKDAASSLREAVRLDPGVAKSHYQLGTALLHLNDKNGAVEQFNEAIARGSGTEWEQLARSALAPLLEKE